MTAPEPAPTQPAGPSGPAPSPAGTVTLAWVAIAFGAISLPGLLTYLPGIRNTEFADYALLAGNAAPFPAIVSWLLAVVATLVSAVRLIRGRNIRSSKRALALAAPGAILGTAALVLVVVYIGNLLGAFEPNEAAQAGEVAVDHYLDQGSTLICANDNNGHGINSTPWYVAYIDAPSDLQSVEQAQDALALASYPDAQAAALSEFYDLPASTEAFAVESLERGTDGYDGAPGTPRASVQVFPADPVSPDCSPPGGDYGDDLTAGEGRVIVVVRVSLEKTR
jgi:uncharacterized integral membrane protein